MIIIIFCLGTACGVVIYTGSETRSVMNTSAPKSKVGIIFVEFNKKKSEKHKEYKK